MRRSQPVACETSPGRLLVLYAGPADPFHGYRAKLSALPARLRHATSQTIISWLLGHADGEHLCGESVGPPQWREQEPTRDLFVLLRAPRDMARFEQRFGVIGFSPLLRF
jgi:hypothetical protein